MDSSNNCIQKDQKIIDFVLHKCAHDIALHVRYNYLRAYLIGIFTDTELENAEGGDNRKPNNEIMLKICDSAKSKSMAKFVEFVYAIKEHHEHVFSNINDAYKNKTGEDLSQIPRNGASIIEDHNIIVFVLRTCAYYIATNVKYNDLRASIRQIFTDTELERAEGHANYDIMVKICDSARCKSMAKFLEFVYAIKEHHEHVFSNINDAYKNKTGEDLSQISNMEAPAAASAIRSATSMSETTESSGQPVISASNQPSESSSTGLNTHNTFIGQGVGPSALQPQQNIPEQMKPKKPETTMQNKPSSISNMEAPAAASAIRSATSMSETTESSGAPVTSASNQPSESSSTGLNTHNTFIGQGVGPSDLQPQQNIPEQMKPKKPETTMQNKPSSAGKDTDPRDCCLIINNEKFDYLPLRNGSTKDCKKIFDLFKHLGFEIIEYKNKTANEMLKILELAASNALHKVSAVAVVILSLGDDNDYLYGTDGAVTKNGPEIGTFITGLEIQSIFDGENCPAMNGKSKLFNLQTCREVPAFLAQSVDQVKVNNVNCEWGKPWKKNLEDENNFLAGVNQTASTQSFSKSCSGIDVKMRPLTVADSVPESPYAAPESPDAVPERSTQTERLFVGVFTPKEGKYAHEMSCDIIVTEVTKKISK